MTEWGTAPPSAGTHRQLAADDPMRLTQGLQSIVQHTSDLQQIARRLSVAGGRDAGARKQFGDALGRTKQAMEDTAAALAAAGPALPRAHLDKVTREYRQAQQSVAALEERGKRLLAEGARADAEAAAAAASAGNGGGGGGPALELALRTEDPAQAMVEERNREMGRLAEDIGALREMMRDAQALVAEQGQQLDAASENALRADVNVEAAAQDLGSAERYARKRRWIIAGITLGAILIVVVIVLIVLKAVGVI